MPRKCVVVSPFLISERIPNQRVNVHHLLPSDNCEDYVNIEMKQNKTKQNQKHIFRGVQLTLTDVIQYTLYIYSLLYIISF